MPRPWATVSLVACGLWSGAARAESVTALICLPPAEMREMVADHHVVAPIRAMRTARRAVPGADVVRANLCRSSDTLVYVITALRKDGRVVQVMIDAPSGELSGVD